MGVYVVNHGGAVHEVSDEAAERLLSGEDSNAGVFRKATKAEVAAFHKQVKAANEGGSAAQQAAASDDADEETPGGGDAES